MQVHVLNDQINYFRSLSLFLRCDDESPYAACAEGTLAESSSGEDQAHQKDLAQAQVVFG